MSAPERMGLALDPTTNDLFFRADNSLAVVVNAEAVGQHGKQRLNTYQGEWFLNTEVGVPWLDEILGKRYDPALGEAIVKSCLLDTDGVTGINSFSVSFEKTTRGLIVNGITITTDYEETAAI